MKSIRARFDGREKEIVERIRVRGISRVMAEEGISSIESVERWLESDMRMPRGFGWDPLLPNGDGLVTAKHLLRACIDAVLEARAERDAAFAELAQERHKRELQDAVKALDQPEGEMVELLTMCPNLKKHRLPDRRRLELSSG